MTEVQERQIEGEVFRIMRHKLKGRNRDSELKCWQMVTVSKAIYQRFGVMPYKIRLKHVLWYLDEELFWIISENTAYRYYLAIKSFCECIDKWGHWRTHILKRSPRLRT